MHLSRRCPLACGNETLRSGVQAADSPVKTASDTARLCAAENVFVRPGRIASD